MKLFVMSDIHSYYEPMMAALNEAGFDIDNPEHRIVVCGDLFDRGPDTVKVFEFAKMMTAKDRFIYVYGNHEELLDDCVRYMCRTKRVTPNDVSNGTLDTIAQLTGIGRYDLYTGLFDSNVVKEKVDEVLGFIYENACDVAEIGDYVFVHGWIPCDPITGEVPSNWDTEDANWDSARWLNGMAAWAKGARLPGKTIVCGHWHTSWGWANLVDNEEYEEFPGRKSNDLRKNFAPFIQDGIIAVDACTAYTGFCNCVVLDV